MLATELLVIICELLPRGNLFSFRLANKTCANIAATSLVRDLHLLFTSKSFQNLLNISRDPNLSKHVKSLHYEPRILRSVSSGEFRNIRLLQQGDAEHKTLEENWMAYRDIAADQAYIKDQCFDFSVLAQALLNLPNIKRINLDSNGPPSDQPFSNHIPTGDVRGSLYDGKLVTLKMNLRAMKSIVAAIGLAHTKLDTFTAIPIPQKFFLTTTDDDRNLILPIAPYLRRVEISFSSFRCFTDNRRVASGVKNFLQPAVNLEELRVTLGSCTRQWIGMGTIWDSLIEPLIRFPKLKRITLSKFFGQ